MIEQVVRELFAQGLTVSSVKHHSHDDFEIDLPGKDSYRHHKAGTVATAIASSTRLALIEDVKDPESLLSLRHNAIDAITALPASSVVIVEGFKQAGFPSIELFRQENPRDVEAVPAFLERLNDPTRDPSSLPRAIVSDIPEITSAAISAGIPCFGFYDVSQISAWIVKNCAKPLLTVAIQCGGESRRMGTSKALVPFHGQPLIEHMVARFAPIADELIVTTNEPEKLAFLQVRYPGVKFTTDRFKKRGALQGFTTALEAARHPNVAVIACDMINVPTDLIEYELDLLVSSQDSEPFIPYDAVVPVTAEGFEPFCGVYLKDRCLEPALASVALKKVRMRHVLEDLNVHMVDAQSDPHCPEGCFTNVNTPEELKRASEVY